MLEMKRKAVATIEMGDVLAQDADVDVGVPLYCKGVEVSEEVITRLRR